MSYGPVLYILGWLMSFFGASMMIPALVSAVAHKADAPAFFFSGCLGIFFGVSFIFMNRSGQQYLTHRDGFLLTLLTWLIMTLLGALPLHMTGAAGSFVDAYFESMSGLTTTGATVISGLDVMDPGILLWRSMLQWFGGMGIVVLAVAVLPFLGIGGMQLYRAEMPGVVKDKLQPRLKETAKLLWIVYLIITFACACAYSMAGMNAFDAICHAFSTVSTGGFSTHDASLGYFNSGAIEVICIIFMLLGAINFSLHYSIIGRWDLKVYTSNPEVRLFVFFILAASILSTLVLILGHQYSIGESFRHSLLLFTSVATTTGYSTEDYAAWPVMAHMLILVLMIVGGCSGSTSGGMKVMRIMMIFKQGQRELERLIHPHGVAHVKVGDQTVSPLVMQAVWSFAALYIVCYILISVLLSAYGIDLITAFSASAAAITSFGPGLGDVGPTNNYAGLPDGAKLLLCFAMLLGRLEIFTLLVVFTPSFWKR